MNLFHRSRVIGRNLGGIFSPLECFNQSLLPLQAHRNTTWTPKHLSFTFKTPTQVFSHNIHRFDFKIHTSILLTLLNLRFSTPQPPMPFLPLNSPKALQQELTLETSELRRRASEGQQRARKLQERQAELVQRQAVPLWRIRWWDDDEWCCWWVKWWKITIYFFREKCFYCL